MCIYILSWLLDIYLQSEDAGGNREIVKHLISHPSYQAFPLLHFYSAFKRYLPNTLLANKFFLHSHTFYFLCLLLFQS